MTENKWGLLQPEGTSTLWRERTGQQHYSAPRLAEYPHCGALRQYRVDWRWCPIFKKISIRSSGQQEAIFLWDLAFKYVGKVSFCVMRSNSRHVSKNLPENQDTWGSRVTCTYFLSKYRALILRQCLSIPDRGLILACYCSKYLS